MKRNVNHPYYGNGQRKGERGQRQRQRERFKQF